MFSWLRELDDLLRGRKTGPNRLAEDRVEVRLQVFVPLAIVLGAVYGFFMGWYSLINAGSESYHQILASMLKLPALFLLTLLVTFPSLYVFNALVGCRLTLAATLRLLVGAIVVNLAVGASLGPILGFFTLCTTSYPFMVVLNVLLLTIGGIVGLSFLLHTLKRLPVSSAIPDAHPADSTRAEEACDASEASAREPGPIDDIPGEAAGQSLGQARAIFRIWVVLYGLVGAQMGWLLRPFIGSPDLDFEWFRPRQGNFFLAVLQQLHELFGGA